MAPTPKKRPLPHRQAARQTAGSVILGSAPALGTHPPGSPGNACPAPLPPRTVDSGAGCAGYRRIRGKGTGSQTERAPLRTCAPFVWRSGDSRAGRHALALRYGMDAPSWRAVFGLAARLERNPARTMGEETRKDPLARPGSVPGTRGHGAPARPAAWGKGTAPALPSGTAREAVNRCSGDCAGRGAGGWRVPAGGTIRRMARMYSICPKPPNPGGSLAGFTYGDRTGPRCGRL